MTYVYIVREYFNDDENWVISEHAFSSKIKAEMQIMDWENDSTNFKWVRLKVK